MFKSAWAAAMVSALAMGRGDLTGTSEADAVTSIIMDNETYSMHLHLWNVKDGSNWKMMGDIEIKATNIQPNVRGSVCIGQPEND